jgi:hypothetical protein
MPFCRTWEYRDSMGIDPVAPLVPTEVEQALLERVAAGQMLDLVGDEFVVDQKDLIPAMRSWGPEHTIRAAVIRDILRSSSVANPDPCGLRLRGARIEGTLDLEYLTSGLHIELIECLLTDGVLLRGASLPAVTLQRCFVTHPDKPPLNADRLITGMLVLTRSIVDAHSEDGGVRLNGAHLGQLKAALAIITNDRGTAFYADYLSVDRDASMDQRFTVFGTGPNGAVRLIGAHIGGHLDFTDAALINTGLGYTETLTDMNGPALIADGIQVDQSLFLKRLTPDWGFQATGGGNTGAVRLMGARIGGQLSLVGATLTNETGPALLAENLNVNLSLLAGPLLFHDPKGCPGQVKFTATGNDALGTVRLLGARVGGQLDFTDATVTNHVGPALAADGLKVDQGLFLRHWQGTGASMLAAVRLSGARVGGQLDFADATLTNPSGPALDARNLVVGHDLIFAGKFAAQGNGKGVVLNLGMVQVGGSFYFRREKVSHATCPCALLNVDGLTYLGLPQKGAVEESPAAPGTKEWLQLIREGTRSYAAQPYQQLATALGAAGNDREARDVLIAQRQDQIGRNALTGRGERSWARFTGIMIGYGYKPSRALFYLLGVVIFSIVLSVTLGAHGGLVQPNSPDQKQVVQCTTLQQATFGLDLGTTLFSTNAGCDTTTSAVGNDLAVVSWAMRLLAWALATLFISGFTGAVRKN